MTREEAISNHRKMWRWLAENPGKKKTDYLREFDSEARLRNDCYLCEYADRVCDCCPLGRPSGRCCAGGLAVKWTHSMISGDYARAAEIARKIAELPKREEEEDEAI